MPENPTIWPFCGSLLNTCRLGLDRCVLICACHPLPCFFPPQVQFPVLQILPSWGLDWEKTLYLHTFCKSGCWSGGIQNKQWSGIASSSATLSVVCSQAAPATPGDWLEMQTLAPPQSHWIRNCVLTSEVWEVSLSTVEFWKRWPASEGTLSSPSFLSK